MPDPFQHAIEKHLRRQKPAEEPYRFDGITYDPQHDRIRLTGQMLRVYEAILDGRWRTLQEIEAITDDPQASISARLRDLRKERFGSHVVERRARGNRKRGLWEYRLASA